MYIYIYTIYTIYTIYIPYMVPYMVPYMGPWGPWAHGPLVGIFLIVCLYGLELKLVGTMIFACFCVFLVFLVFLCMCIAGRDMFNEKMRKKRK